MKRSILAVFASVLVLCVVAPLPAHASDHADPIFLKDPDANITGLFFFPRGDQMILILNVRRGTGRASWCRPPRRSQRRA